MDPFTVVVAQTIAGVPLLSGIVYRTIVFACLLGSAVLARVI
jgi:uncharacterized ion transporter superfamily protein YfcC